MPDTERLYEAWKTQQEEEAAKQIIVPPAPDLLEPAIRKASQTNPDKLAGDIRTGQALGIPPEGVEFHRIAAEEAERYKRLRAQVDAIPEPSEWLKTPANMVLVSDDMDAYTRVSEARKRAVARAKEDTDRANIGRASKLTSPLYSLGGGLATLFAVPGDVAYWGTSAAARLIGADAPSKEAFEKALLFSPLAVSGLLHAGATRAKEWYEGKERITPSFFATDPVTGAEFFNTQAISVENAAQILLKETPSMAAMMGLEYLTGGGATPLVGAKLASKLGVAGKVLKYALRPSAMIEVGRSVQAIHDEGIKTLTAKGMSEKEAAAKAAPGAALAGIASFALGAPLQAKYLDDMFTSMATLKTAATWAGKGKTVLKQATLQGTKEGAQEVLNGFGEDLGRWVTFQPDLTIQQAAQNALGNFLGGAVMGGALGGAAHAPATIRAAQNREFFQALADGAKESKLLKRLPESWQESVKAQVKDGPLEYLRISPQAFTVYLQSQNIAPAEMAATLGVPNFQESLITGNEILIPTDAYARHIATTEHHGPLSQDLRIGEDGVTLREAEAAEKNRGKMEALAREVMADLDAATMALPEFEQIKNKAMERYLAAGETPALADTYAMDMAKVVYTMAQREGLKPLEVAEHWIPRMVRGQAPRPEDFTAEAFTEETFPDEGVQWWEGDALYYQEAYGAKPERVDLAPGVVDKPFQQADYQEQLADWEKSGAWYYNERRIVPIDAIGAREPWDEARRVDAEGKLGATGATVPVVLSTEDGGKTYKIQDGIHRINAAKAQGFTAIPAEVQVVVSDRAPVEGDFQDKDRLGTETADSRIYYQTSKPIFYSALSRAIPEIQKIADKEGKISPDQAKAWILARQKEGKIKQVNSIDITPKLAAAVAEGLPLFQSQKRDFSFGSKAWNEYYRDRVGKNARAAGDQAKRSRKGLESAATKRGQLEFDEMREADLRAEEEAFMRFDRAVEGIAKPRGWFTRADDGTLIIGKTPEGDFSTWIHEPAHVYLELFQHLSTRDGASAQIQDDAGKVLKFLGVDSWDKIGTAEHEKWARANELYCREGKAPSEDLRSVFERFRVWLTAIYKRVQELDVELNEDIRGVFDRMRATDEEIETAHADITGPRLFTSPEEAGLNEDDFEKYAREKDMEIAKAKVDILAKLNQAAIREKAREWKEEESEVRAALEMYLDAQPEFQAVAMLRAGKLEDGTPFTLSKTALMAQFGEDRVKALQNAHPGIYRVEGQLTADDAAEILGFENGEALMNALEETPKRGEVLKAEVQRVMTERHGDIRYDGTLEDQARQAVMNEDRAKNLMRELELLRGKEAKEGVQSAEEIQALRDDLTRVESAKVETAEDVKWLEKQANALMERNEALRGKLETKEAKIQALRDDLDRMDREQRQRSAADRSAAKAARESVPPLKSFREEAQRIIGNTQNFLINANTHLQAQRKYSREAWVKATRNDYAAAVDAKEKELLNHFLYLEAKKAQKAAADAFKYAQKLQRPAAMEAISKAGGEGGQRVYWDQIQNILNEYEFVKLPNRNLRDLALFVQEHEDDGIIFDALSLPGPKNYRELTPVELAAVVDALKNIEHVARHDGRLLSQLKGIEFRAEVEGAVKSAYGTHKGKLKRIPSAGEALTELEKLPRTIEGWRSYLGKMEWWVDKLDGGDVNGPWRRNIITPIREASGRVQVVAHRINGDLRRLYESLPRSFQEDLDKPTPIMFPGRDVPLTRRQLRSWALNLGTEENRNVALLGEGLMNEDGTPTALVDKALSELTSDEWRFVQGVWDICETLRPDIEAQALRVSGVAPKWKAVTPFKVQTKDGIEIQIRGGYYPQKADPYRSQVGEKQADAEIPKTGQAVRPTTSTAHKKKVTGATYRLKLDYVSGLTQHINDVVMDTYAYEAIRDVYKFIRNGDVKTAIQETMGHSYYAELLPWLLDFTNANRIAAMEDKDVLQPVLRFKSGMVVSKLGLNLLSHTVQITDPLKAAVDPDMKPHYLLKGYAALAADPSKYALIRELSPGMMRYRAENWNRDLREMLDYPGPFSSKMEAFRQWSMHGFSVMDKLATSGAWWGRFQQGMDAHGNQAQAVMEADRLIARDFQAGAPENISRIMRSKGWMNVLTTFGGDANTWFGILDASLRSGSPKRMGMVLLGLLAEQLLSQLLRNRLPEDDEEGQWLLMQMGSSVFGKIPIVGDAAEMIIRTARGEQSDLQNPVFQGAERTVKASISSYKSFTDKEDAEKAAIEAAEALGMVFGVPGTAQGLKTWRYLRDVREGEREEADTEWQGAYRALVAPPKKGGK